MKTIKLVGEFLFLVVVIFSPSINFFYELFKGGSQGLGWPDWLTILAIPIAASPFLIIVLMLQDLRRKSHGKS